MYQKYSIGTMAHLMGISAEALRYYESKNIVSPIRDPETGYRYFNTWDFHMLLRARHYQNYGFSLEEIMAMTINDDSEDIAHSLELQKDLIRKRILHLQKMEKTLEDTAQMLEQSGKVDWNDILNLIHITNMEHAIVEQYKNAVNLNVRIALHQRFSHNPVPWFTWLADQIALKDGYRVLETGCGNGELWCHRSQIPDICLYLTDISSGMVEDAMKRLREERMPAAFSKKIQFGTEDCQKFSFPDQAFDTVIANHVLFYVKNLPQALKEVRRVLKTGGTFYCSTYGKNHMKEITSMVQEFDPRITLSEVALYELFGLENGEGMLREQFEEVELRMYEDYLLVDEAEPLLDYILSCHGNQSEILNQRQLEFKAFLQKKIEEHGAIKITKMAGMFVCRKKSE